MLLQPLVTVQLVFEPELALLVLLLLQLTDEEPTTPLSVSLKTLSLSRSETIDEPRSVMLSARLLQI